MFAALTLYGLTIKQFLRRLWYSFAVELVVGLCSLVLVGLFYYIFSDFLHTQAQEISPRLARILGNSLASIIAFFAALHCGNLLSRSFLSNDHLAQVAERLGEAPRVLRSYRLLQIPSLVLIIYGPSLSMVWYGFSAWTLAEMMVVLVAMLAVTLISFAVHQLINASVLGRLSRPIKRPLLHKPSAKRTATMVWWRLQQLLRRNRTAQVLLSGAFLGMVIEGWWFSQGAPHLLLVLLAFAAGLGVATALISQIAQDCRSLWIEKMCGVGHNDFMNTLELLALVFASSSAAVQALSMVSWHIMMHHDLSSLDWLLFLKVSAISFSLPFLVPYLALQIDGKRGGIQVITLILAGLLIGTAIFAHIVSLALLPFIAHYGRSSQRDRFYYT